MKYPYANRKNLLPFNSFIKRIVICVLLSLSLSSIAVFAQERKYTVGNGHAHNDYNHPVPFYTAYDAGFGSIEADIILQDNHLYVAHDEKDIDTGRTLQSLYLNPLQQVKISTLK